MMSEQPVPGHDDIFYDLGTPREFTARGGWNIRCECGVVFAETGDDDEDFEERWQQHLADVANHRDTPQPPAN